MACELDRIDELVNDETDGRDEDDVPGGEGLPTGVMARVRLTWSPEELAAVEARRQLDAACEDQPEEG